MEPHTLALKRQERLGLTSLAEEALYESFALSLAAAGGPGPTTVSPATQYRNREPSQGAEVCAPQGLPWPALLPTAHSWGRPGVHS